MATEKYRVLCREDRAPDGTAGRYVLATQRSFPTRAKATEYARTIASSREPLVVEVVWAPEG